MSKFMCAEPLDSWEKPSSPNRIKYSVRAVCSSASLLLLSAIAGWQYIRAGESVLDSNISDNSLTCPNIKIRNWDWNIIRPSRALEWHKCFDGFDCARLDVPLDWLDPSDDERAVLAVIRLPATTKTDYKGPVLMNPGGPGGSGIYSLRDHGRSLQTIIGKNHDLISWDPRGVGASTPRLDCWTSQQRANIWSLQDVGVIDSHPGVLYDAFARSLAYSQSCASAMAGPKSPLKFVSTASHARDMLEILDKTGWSKLRYWGFSYGTVLGVTFASMYPEKVERMVNDGNVDLTEWTSGRHIHFMQDTDKVMEAFYRFCHIAGPENCALHASSPSAIEDRFQQVLNDLKVHPIIVPTPPQSMDYPELITYSSLKRLISAALYRPVFMFPSLARVVASLESGDGEPFLNLITTEGMRKQFSCECNIDSIEDLESSDDAFPSIMCSDGEKMTGGVEEFEKYADNLMTQSKSAGAVNVLFRMSCAGWEMRPKWRYSGPFTGNTSHPILFIANIADNVTPMRSAVMNSKGFNDSVVLVQKSYGHTSLTAPSKCTAARIRAYFQDGDMPSPHTECVADVDPFQIINLGPAGDLGEEENELHNALWHLTNNMRWRHYSGSI
ncbi:alpha/beta hydrolase fold family protein [Phlyctema vagabunda]|uniref:Alpha/beta hydrolase fold family protein n=1 Tax=Phlyctema vagabunda TaxID=108571 RepID=A0ABR4PHE1_9HELO